MKVLRLCSVDRAVVPTLLDQMRCLVANGVELTILCEDTGSGVLIASTGATFCDFKFRRRPSFGDFATFVRLGIYIRNNSFDLIHTSTPKVGLLGILCSILFSRKKIPVIHTFTGQHWRLKNGLILRIYITIDRLISNLVALSLFDSPQQAKFCRRLKIGMNSSGWLANGSFGGVDFSKFNLEQRSLFRGRKNDDSLCFGFVGRICLDKGVFELLTGFRQFIEWFTKEGIGTPPKLIVLGDFDDEPSACLELMKLMDSPQILHLGWVADPREVIANMDVLFLPSYREGFGSVVVEAAALGVMSVVSNIYGLRDSAKVGAIKIAPKSVEAVRDVMISIQCRSINICSPDDLSQSAKDSFDSKQVAEDLLGFYRAYIAENLRNTRLR